MIADERGFTLIEILVSLAIFAVVVVGALGVLGAAGSGGFLEGFPTGFVTTRVARDITAASVYLQAFQEYAAGRGSSALTVGSYCWGPDNCPTPNLPSAGLGLAPTPPTQPYQLDARTLNVIIDRWYACLNTSGAPLACTATSPCFVKYSVATDASCNTLDATDSLLRIDSKLTWRYRGVTRTLEVNRFIP